MAKTASKRVASGKGRSTGAKKQQQKRTSGKAGAPKRGASAKGKKKTTVKKKASAPRLAQKSKSKSKASTSPTKKKKVSKRTNLDPRLAQKRKERGIPKQGAVGGGWFEYSVLDNGGIPFRVRYNKSKLQIFKMPTDGGVIVAEVMKGKPLRQYAIKRVFVGKNDRVDVPEKYRAAGTGNSMLFLLTNGKYLHVGCEVFEFSTWEDEIVSYHSPIGNSEVPYPYAIGKRRAYLMLEKMMAENSALIGAKYKDPYPAYYGFDKKLGKAAKKFFTKFPVKMIDKGFH
jgi:hypothetical protein